MFFPALRLKGEVVDDGIGGDGEDRLDARKISPQNAYVEVGVGPVPVEGRGRHVARLHVLGSVGFIVGLGDLARAADTWIVAVPLLAGR